MQVDCNDVWLRDEIDDSMYFPDEGGLLIYRK